MSSAEHNKLLSCVNATLERGTHTSEAWQESCQMLLERAKTTGAIQFGEFVLTSGAKSKVYFDGRILALDPIGGLLIASLVLCKAFAVNANVCGGPAIGAVPIIGSAVALAALKNIEVGGVFIRPEPKTHGTQKRIEGTLPKDCRMLLVEDTLTTGKSMLASLDTITKQAGNIVVSSICVMDRMSGGRQELQKAGIPLQSLMQMDPESGDVSVSGLDE